ncbi:MAG: PEGA domain-containing protein [Polyangiaceae bacterium]|nr:PEGA domain-containing protein [Polyangiaceae bacterium]
MRRERPFSLEIKQRAAPKTATAEDTQPWLTEQSRSSWYSCSSRSPHTRSWRKTHRLSLTLSRVPPVRRTRGGQLLHTEGDHASALARFQSAYELSKDPRLLLYQAGCERAPRRYSAAESLLERYLAEGGSSLSPGERAVAENLIRAVAPSIASVQLDANEGAARVTVDGVERATTPLAAPVRVDMGVHRIMVVKPGFVSFERSIKIEGGSMLRLDVRLLPEVRQGMLRVTAAAAENIAIVGSTFSRAEITFPADLSQEESADYYGLARREQHGVFRSGPSFGVAGRVSSRSGGIRLSAVGGLGVGIRHGIAVRGANALTPRQRRSPDHSRLRPRRQGEQCHRAPLSTARLGRRRGVWQHTRRQADAGHLPPARIQPQEHGRLHPRFHLSRIRRSLRPYVARCLPPRAQRAGEGGPDRPAAAAGLRVASGSALSSSAERMSVPGNAPYPPKPTNSRPSSKWQNP